MQQSSAAERPLLPASQEHWLRSDFMPTARESSPLRPVPQEPDAVNSRLSLERELLQRAIGGDEKAFTGVFTWLQPYARAQAVKYSHRLGIGVGFDSQNYPFPQLGTGWTNGYVNTDDTIIWHQDRRSP